MSMTSLLPTHVGKIKKKKSNASNAREIKSITGQGDDVSPAIFPFALLKDPDFQVHKLVSVSAH